MTTRSNSKSSNNNAKAKTVKKSTKKSTKTATSKRFNFNGVNVPANFDYEPLTKRDGTSTVMLCSRKQNLVLDGYYQETWEACLSAAVDVQFVADMVSNYSSYVGLGRLGKRQEKKLGKLVISEEHGDFYIMVSDGKSVCYPNNREGRLED